MYTNKTNIFGILGFPLGHTLSPWIHNHLFKLANIDGIYLVFEKPDWPTHGPESLLTLGIKGVSVTIPFKEWAFKIADSACPASQAMKASNTLLFRDGKISAHNTDGEGALSAILSADTSLLNPKPETKILMLGSGGSAKGIIYSLAKYLQASAHKKNSQINKNKIRILARNKVAIDEIIKSVNAGTLISPITMEEAMDQSRDFSLVIHTTPVGMKGIGGEPILARSFFHKEATLFDIVYNPMETSLVKEAKKGKSRIIPGYSMLLFQGIKQFELFTETKVKKSWVKEIEKILIKKLKTTN